MHRPERAPPVVRDRGPTAERAREICLRQLAVRPAYPGRARHARCASGGISDEVAAEVLDRYDEVGIIDDAAFARAWVTSRHHGRGLARRALASELRPAGRRRRRVDAALAELDPDTEAATARALVDRKLRTATGAPGRGVPPAGRHARPQGVPARPGDPGGQGGDGRHSAEMAELAEQIDPDAVEPEYRPAATSVPARPRRPREPLLVDHDGWRRNMSEFYALLS